MAWWWCASGSSRARWDRGLRARRQKESHVLSWHCLWSLLECHGLSVMAGSFFNKALSWVSCSTPCCRSCTFWWNPFPSLFVCCSCICHPTVLLALGSLRCDNSLSEWTSFKVTQPQWFSIVFQLWESRPLLRSVSLYLIVISWNRSNFCSSGSRMVAGLGGWCVCERLQWQILQQSLLIQSWPVKGNIYASGMRHRPAEDMYVVVVQYQTQIAKWKLLNIWRLLLETNWCILRLKWIWDDVH